jgi:AcrR family transcriptional regulator
VTVDQQQRTGPPAPRRRSRRDEILEIAVGLFAARGYHGVSMDDIGSAAGVTGPALYHHFAGKEAMLVAALIPVSEGLLNGGRDRVARHPEDARAALVDLIEFHVEFALDRLPDDPRRQIRRLQRLYVEEWVIVLGTLRPELEAGEARVLAHSAFGLMNSTPFLGGEVDRHRRATLLRAATVHALTGH